MRQRLSVLILGLLVACDGPTVAAFDAAAPNDGATDASPCGVAPADPDVCPAVCGPGAGGDMAACCQQVGPGECLVCATADDGGPTWQLATIDCF